MSVKDDRASEMMVDNEPTLVDVSPPEHEISKEECRRSAELDAVVASAIERFGGVERLEEGSEPSGPVPEGLMRWLERAVVRRKPVPVTAHGADSAGADAASYATTAAPARSVASRDPTEKIVIADLRPSPSRDASREAPTIVGIRTHRRRSAAPLLVAAGLGALVAVGVGLVGWPRAQSPEGGEKQGPVVMPSNAGASPLPTARSTGTILQAGRDPIGARSGATASDSVHVPGSASAAAGDRNTPENPKPVKTRPANPLHVAPATHPPPAPSADGTSDDYVFVK
jgi:hypothetical protein